MKLQEIKIALAEWEGYTRNFKHNFDGDLDRYIHPKREGEVYLPDYLNDLNAVHELEKTAIDTPQLREQYIKYLAVHFGWSGIYHCTALQRCEALLRTLGKWKNSS